MKIDLTDLNNQVTEANAALADAASQRANDLAQIEDLEQKLATAVADAEALAVTTAATLAASQNDTANARTALTMAVDEVRSDYEAKLSVMRAEKDSLAQQLATATARVALLEGEIAAAAAALTPKA